MDGKIRWSSYGTVACISAICLTGLGGVISAGEAAEVRSFYVMEIENEGHEYRVAINGQGVIGEQPVNRKYVEAFLRHGENALEINFRRKLDWQPDQEKRVPKFEVRLVKELFPGEATQERKTLFAYRAREADLLPNEWRKEIATVTLSLRGIGESYYELEAWPRGCSINVALNGSWSETINDISSQSRVPLTAFRSGDNILEVLTQSLKPDAQAPQWTVTLYKRWVDGGFEPLAHLEADKPTMGFSKRTTLAVEDLPALKPLTEEPVKNLTRVDEQAIRNVVQQLHTAYQAGNTEEVLAFEGVALKNMWEQYGISSERQTEVLKSTTEQLKQAFRSSWKLPPLPTELTFTPEGGLVKVGASQALIDGSFVTEEVVTVGSEHQTTQSKGQLKRKVLYLAKKNGRWEIVKFDF